jgi:hypothetical protein
MKPTPGDQLATDVRATLLTDARRLLRVLAPLCACLSPEKRAHHLTDQCTELARRIERELPKEAW